MDYRPLWDSGPQSGGPLDPKSPREKSLISRDSKVWGFSASWHGCKVETKAHVQEEPYELLSVKGSRADAGAISADLGPGAVREDTPRGT